MEIPIRESEQNLLPAADWEVEIRRLQEELLRERDRNLRTLADFKNYRRRVEQDGNRTSKEGKRAIILPLLDILDDMEKALPCANAAEQSILKGVQMIQRKFLVLLETHGVVSFESVGMPFDHQRQEAIAVVTDKETEPGIVVDELRRGYLLNNELLRTAQVRVAG
jgi:molecular chaperone GrpE